jgi:hypothetical protein
MNANLNSLTHANLMTLAKLLVPSLLVLAMVISGTPLMVNRSAAAQTPEVRQIKIKRPSNHPVAIKQIRNVQGADFLRNLEIEVQNVSNKPIYYVSLHLGFPDIEVKPNVHYGFGLIYGDEKFLRVSELAGPQDKPIPPGRTYTFKVPSNIYEGFDGYRADVNLPAAAANRIELKFEEVSFGDGTGYSDDLEYQRRQSLRKNS